MTKTEQALRLILKIEANPGDHIEIVKLAPQSRNQLQEALEDSRQQRIKLAASFKELLDFANMVGVDAAWASYKTAQEFMENHETATLAELKAHRNA